VDLTFTPQMVSSWGRLNPAERQVARVASIGQLQGLSKGSVRLAIGARRSYGDVGLGSEGGLIDMTGLDRFKRFDPATGVLTAEAGLTLSEVLRVFAPRGWFLPVTPGTRHVTLGGAVANDVHGKNHHRAGTFGRHVLGLTLLRSDRGTIEVTPETDPELFAATIGGLGLTGLILDVTLRLQPIASTELVVETLALGDLEALCDGLEESAPLFEHTVAWIDCAASGRSLGRGLLTRADWATQGPHFAHSDGRGPRWPTENTGILLNALSLKAFNAAYYTKGALASGSGRRPYEKVFYPLDGVRDWNRLYGRAGFFQYQCVVPRSAGRAPLRTLVQEISRSGEGSFLAVLKSFGDAASPGLLSFPQEGWTLALDFRNRGAATLALFERLDAIVAEAGGRLYPAKDARMSAAMFAAGYPVLDRFRASIDNACVSDLRRRLNL